MRPEFSRPLLSALALFVWVQAVTAQPVAAQPVRTAAEKPAATEAGPEATRIPAEACSRIVLRRTPGFLFVDGFESGDTSAWLPAAAARLSVQRVLDLELEVLLDAAVTGEHLLRLELETPKGHLYQRLTVPFSSSPSSPRARKVAGHPRPLAVQVATARGAEAPPVVSFSFPVAGTAIVHSSLYGTWRARPFLDDSTTPCGDALAFVLTP